MPPVLLTVILVLFSAILNTSAQVMLKMGAEKLFLPPIVLGKLSIHPLVVGGLGLYGLSAVVYISLLGRLNLSMVYPIIIGLTTIATITAGMLVFQEKVSFTSWIGVGLVLAGVSAITLGRSG